MDISLANVIFAGVFHHAMDTKNRVTIPARWRRSEIDEFYVVPSPKSDFLRVIPPEEMQRISRDVRENTNISAKDKAVWERGFYRRAQHVTTDRQGRIVLPDEHAKSAALSGEVVLIGVDRTFEIWNPAQWNATAEAEDKSYEQISELVGL